MKMRVQAASMPTSSTPDKASLTTVQGSATISPEDTKGKTLIIGDTKV